MDNELGKGIDVNKAFSAVTGYIAGDKNEKTDAGTSS